VKILFLGSNPDNASSVTLDRDITELQRKFVDAPGEEVQYVFLPALRIEQLAHELTTHSPDIVHIVAHGECDAHGEHDVLVLSDANSAPIETSPSKFLSFLNPKRLPSLIYVNACHSREFAKALTSKVPIAIGASATIFTGAARSAAVTFYGRLLAGFTVDESFRAAKDVLEVIQAT
jgi:hypothetical protein